jgi:hypothetical protein
MRFADLESSTRLRISWHGEPNAGAYHVYCGDTHRSLVVPRRHPDFAAVERHLENMELTGLLVRQMGDEVLITERVAVALSLLEQISDGERAQLLSGQVIEVSAPVDKPAPPKKKSPARKKQAA